MRRINSEFQTKYISEEGHKLTNRDYFGYVEMDDYACYVMADSLDGDIEANSAKFVVESMIRSFVEHPSMWKEKLRKYIQTAHRELQKEHKGMRLTASVSVVVTDYKKMRYCCVGNSRFYLIRNNRFYIMSKDQSLTQNLLIEEKIPMDQAAAHEERNNLYSYLGERGQPEIIISKKMNLENGDILAQLTRGIWERCSDEELLQFVEDAKEPKDILDQVEDAILGKQEISGEIDNYSLALTNVKKVYQSPKKKVTVKKVLMIALPIIIVIGGISITLYLRHRSIKKKETNLIQYMISGENYLRYDNYKKASEEYAEAKKLANSLKKNEDNEDLEEADQYLKLSDQILLADEAMIAGEYKKAQELYITARELSVDAGNVGKKYIDSQLKQTKEYIEVFDFIARGEEKEANANYKEAISSYKQAKEKASSLYYGDGKEEALNKQTALESKLEEASQKKDAEEEAKKEKEEAAKEKEEAAKKAAEEQEAAEKKEAEEKKAAEQEKEEAAKKEAEEKEAAAKKEAEEKEEAAKKETEEKEAAAKKEAEEKIEAAKKEAEEKKAAEKKEAEEKEAAAKQKEEETRIAAEEKVKREKEAALELENLQKINNQKNAIELENKGNEYVKTGEYDNAMTYYRAAQVIYDRLELTDMADAVNDKINAAQAGKKAAELLETGKNE